MTAHGGSIYKEPMLAIGPKVGTPRLDVRVVPTDGKRRRRREKTWLEERTENFDAIERFVEKSFREGCVEMGPGQTLRLGRVLGIGSYGSVYAAELLGPENDTIARIAVKLTLDRGYTRLGVMVDEESVNRTVSEKVLDLETPHFLLFYGSGHCEDAYVPPGMEFVYRDALGIQRWKNTAMAYVDRRIARDVRLGKYENLPQGLQILFNAVIRRRAMTDELFLDGLFEFIKEYYEKDDPFSRVTREEIVLQPMPTSTEIRVHAMEKATYSIRDFVEIVKDEERIEDLLLLHDVIGQIFQAVKDFYDATGYVHLDLHSSNAMVLRRDSDVPKYVLVLIDFGAVTEPGRIYNPEAFMISMFMNSLRVKRYIPDSLANAIDALIDSTILKRFISWNLLRAAFEQSPVEVSSADRFAMGMGQMGLGLMLDDPVERVDVEALSAIWTSLGPREEPISSSMDVFGLL